MTGNIGNACDNSYCIQRVRELLGSALTKSSWLALKLSNLIIRLPSVDPGARAFR